jgi:hypothetical protein
MLELNVASDEIVHQEWTVDTQDSQDHSYAGVMFDVMCKPAAMHYLEVSALWVRGDLGPMTVWATPGSFEGKKTCEDLWGTRVESLVPGDKINGWTLLYAGHHQPSRQHLQPLRLQHPLRLAPGNSCGVYIHSQRVGDDQIVYDNLRQPRRRRRDRFLEFSPALAHLCPTPFSSELTNGMRQLRLLPWRSQREFVGRITYGVRWLMWNPEFHSRLPVTFQRLVKIVLMCAKRPESPFFLLNADQVMYILNKCSWWSFASEEETGNGEDEDDGSLEDPLPSHWPGNQWENMLPQWGGYQWGNAGNIGAGAQAGGGEQEDDEEESDEEESDQEESDGTA